MTPPRPVIVGVGNTLLGDEGVGVHAIDYLRKAGLDRCADLVDGGTGGLLLMDLLDGREHAILIDATDDGQPIGTVSLLSPASIAACPATMTAHDVGLKEVLQSLTLIGRRPPRVDIITITIAPPNDVAIILSPAIADAMPTVLLCVRRALATC